MATTEFNNDLYLVVLPIISLSPTSFGKTEQVLTLLPDKNQATAFFPDEVGNYLTIFKSRAGHLQGGHVTGYEFQEETTSSGRVLVRVTQNVQ